MRLTSALLAASALNLVVGCSAPSQSPNDSPFVSANAAHVNVGPTVRGVYGRIAVPTMRHAVVAPHGWPIRNKTASILFISDVFNNVVEMYDPTTPNPSPEGSITDGISTSSGLAVDKKGTLYVSNFGPGSYGSVTVYPVGQSSPSLTITDGLDSPEGIAVDSHGTVFVANTSNFVVSVYKAGKKKPSRMINLVSFGQPVGLAIDSHDNLWAAIDSSQMVVEVPAGSSTGVNAGLTDLLSPVGISIGKKDELFVSNFPTSTSGQGYVNVYAAGSTTPAYTITKGIDPGLNGPTLNGLTDKDWLFQSNQFGVVSGYKKGKTTPFSTISGLDDPNGIASSPEVAK